MRAVADRLYAALVAARGPAGAAPKANDEEYLNGVLTATFWELEDLAVDLTGRLAQQGHPTQVCLEAVVVLLATAREHARLSLDGLLGAFQGALAAFKDGAAGTAEASPSPRHRKGSTGRSRTPGGSIAV